MKLHRKVGKNYSFHIPIRVAFRFFIILRELATSETMMMMKFKEEYQLEYGTGPWYLAQHGGLEPAVGRHRLKKEDCNLNVCFLLSRQ